MADQLTQDILKVIEAHLPAETSNVLTKILAQGRADHSTVERITLELNEARAQLQQQADLATRERRVVEAEGGLNRRDAEIMARENKQAVWEANLKVEAAEKRASDAIHFVEIVFRSPVYTKNAWTNRHIANPSGYQEAVTDSSGETTQEQVA